MTKNDTKKPKNGGTASSPPPQEAQKRLPTKRFQDPNAVFADYALEKNDGVCLDALWCHHAGIGCFEADFGTLCGRGGEWGDSCGTPRRSGRGTAGVFYRYPGEGGVREHNGAAIVRLRSQSPLRKQGNKSRNGA